MTAAVLVVIAELGVISWVRHRYMETPALSAVLHVDWEVFLCSSQAS